MTTDWDGRKWQDYCLLLLTKRYSTRPLHPLQIVPDGHRGDLGLEAFSHDGVVYQCYASEEPLSTLARFEKQRDKLTRDLKKLVDKQGEVSSMLGNTVIKSYVFMVPLFNSRFLIPHAHTKATEMIRLGLPFISNDFRITIETHHNYRVEMASLHAIPQPIFSVPLIESDQTNEWSLNNPDLEEVVNRKLKSIIPLDGARSTVLAALMKQFLMGENALGQLRNYSPDGFSSVMTTKSRKENLLVLEYPFSASNTQATMNKVVDDLIEELLRSTPIIDREMAGTLAWAAVADWLMRCPLDF
ncbi:MAG: hypothetical protein Q8L08_07430 [Candidatus Nanopelagicaceae bacterium]|nr:hypothetical protein [Candidatus Nanopelagicaceae bacterium]